MRYLLIVVALSHAAFADEKTWQDFYYQEVKQLQDMTAAGFLTPVAPRQQDDHIVLDSPLAGIDWAHPVGFVLIDCNHRSAMVDGKTSATISWDVKRHCLIVKEHKQ